VSQPFNRACEVPAPAELDESLDEFWSGNAFSISRSHNLSGYERNRTYLNVAGKNFVEVSFVSGTDTDGDGRCVVPLDYNNDGRQDLIVRQVGGGAVKLYENKFPKQNWLCVSLRGVESNRLGIGARIVAKIGARQVVRELWPVNTYYSQAPSSVHLGLGSSVKVDELHIRWPSGKEQRLTGVEANRHILIKESDEAVHTITPGEKMPF
jgi:hypothetical protein